MRAVRRRDVAQHVGRGADPVQVVRRRAAPSRACVCSRMPSGRCRRAASYAAARERSRPTVSGNTIPGNSTTLRTGTMISASSGSARDGLAPSGRALGRAGAGAGRRVGAQRVVGRCDRRFVHDVPSATLAQPQDQATIPDFARAVSSRASGKRNAPLEIAIRNLQPPQRARRRRRTAGSARRAPRARPTPSSPRCAAPERPGSATRTTTSRSSSKTSTGGSHVTRRSPGGGEAEELPVHPLGLLDQLAGLRPHPIRRKA